MLRTAYLSACGIPDRDWVRRLWTACSRRSTPPRPRAWVWAWPSVVRSSKPTGAGCGPAPTNRGGQCFSSAFLYDEIGGSQFTATVQAALGISSPRLEALLLATGNG